MSKAKTLRECKITPNVIGCEVACLLSEYAYRKFEGKEPGKFSTYAAGIADLANALIKRYEGSAG